MSKLTEELREKKVYNPHDLVGKGGYLLYWQPGGTWGPTRGWVLTRIGYRLSNEEAKRDRGVITFGTFGEKGTRAEAKQKALEKAILWAKENGRVTEPWVRDAFLDYQPASQLARRYTELGVALPRDLRMALEAMKTKGAEREL